MTATNNTADPEVSEELRLLRKIDQKVEAIEDKVGDMKKQAAAYGAAAGGISGAIAAVGVLIAKSKLGF
jgi:hypothetical protein